MAGKISFTSPDEVEAVFYEAFMRCDLEVMDAVWAEGEVVCVHPGSGAIVGHDKVMRSWTHILSNAGQPQITFMVGMRSETTGLAVHHVAEELSSAGMANAVVIATNVYRKFDDGWRMVAHHASLVQSSPEGRTLQ